MGEFVMSLMSCNCSVITDTITPASQLHCVQMAKSRTHNDRVLSGQLEIMKQKIVFPSGLPGRDRCPVIRVRHVASSSWSHAHCLPAGM